VVWAGGMTGLLLFFCWTLWTSSMLADVFQMTSNKLDAVVFAFVAD
jgi:hypothetical protein